MTLTLEAVQEAINSGDLDANLAKLKEAVDSRMKTIRTTKTNKDFGIGDKVRFNDSCGTRYVVGLTATVVGMKQKKMIVKLDTPVGRFAKYLPNGEVVSADITVPPGIVDLI